METTTETQPPSWCSTCNAPLLSCTCRPNEEPPYRPNYRAGALRQALNSISLQTSCGWARRCANDALQEDDRRRAIENVERA